MQDNTALEQLAAALDGHEVTNDEGQIEEQTAIQESAPEEQNTETESTTTEKSPDTYEEASKASDEESESELAEDESGKRYVPIDRFEKVYGKAKAAERRAQQLEELLQNLNNVPAQQAEQPKTKGKQQESQPTESMPQKADLLELKLTLPQFDPKPDEYGRPTNPDYNPTLDSLGYRIWKSNPSMSLVDAGREALRLAKEISRAQVEAQTEARRVKSISSDQGITSRVLNRQESNDTPGDDASLEELETYLKKTGQWDAKS